jgi:phosphatidylglycerol:prolipoprotein diacylglycerol transferase
VDAAIYFFWISLTITVCLSLSLRRAHQQKFPLDLFFSVTFWMLVLIPMGARLMHILYEEPSYYFEEPLRMLQIWRGGFVYYGGVIASLVFFAFYFRKPRKKNFWQTADFFAPILALGTGIGRWACFYQGCCYGKELHAFWAVHGMHPTQLYIFAWEMILFIILLRLEKRPRRMEGHLFLFWLAGSAAGRFIIEFYRADFRGQMLWGLSISQIVSLGLILLVGLLSFVKFYMAKTVTPSKSLQAK